MLNITIVFKIRNGIENINNILLIFRKNIKTSLSIKAKPIRCFGRQAAEQEAKTIKVSENKNCNHCIVVEALKAENKELQKEQDISFLLLVGNHPNRFRQVAFKVKAERRFCMTQSREDMQKRIKRASNKKILRRQMELLAEYSRTSGIDKIPESSEAMVSVHRQLLKAEWIFFMRFLVTLFGFLYLMKSFLIKGIQFIKRQVLCVLI